MELRRTFLMAAIAVVAYLMFVTWQQDFSGDGKLATAQQAKNGSTTASTGTNNKADGNLTASLDAGKGTTQESGVILVSTDVLDARISKAGGDLVSLDLKKYPVHVKTPEQPFPLLADTGTLFFEAQSGLVGPDGTDTASHRPVYASEKSSYQLEDGQDKLTVTLSLPTKAGVTITKRYVFTRGDYLIQVQNRVENQSAHPWEGAFYGQLKRNGAGDPSVEGKGMSAMGTYLGAAYYSAENKYEKLKLDEFEKSPLQLKREGGWIALSQHYFLAAWIGDSNQENTYTTTYKKEGSPFYILRYISPLKVVEPGATASFESQLYAGPKEQQKLDAISPGLGLTIDYGWSWFIAEPIFAALVFLESGRFSLFSNHFSLGTGVGNWGLAIILLTLVIKLLFFKLSATSYRSMAKMRKVGPEMKRIKEQFKDDRQKQSQEMMKLYQKEKINPIGGCLPMFIQAPVFIALYYVLLYAVELRQAPFYGWITDLSVMDPWFILPLLMGITMYFQMHLNPAPADPMQAKIMKWMPVGFTVFFFWFPAGLVLYYVTNNLLSIAQQYVITRNLEKES